MKSIKIQVTGLVQGVGFRPFVYRLAAMCNITGRVFNDPAGVWIFAQGREQDLKDFIEKIYSEKPPSASIEELKTWENSFQDYSDFLILASPSNQEQPKASVLPDLKICENCLKELTDFKDRRFRYPFINCTDCGPRFSIITSLPYDRARTTMSEFIFCDECKKEYEDPASRRFHAEPIACSKCGPKISLYDNQGNFLVDHDQAIESLVGALNKGQIVAIKGIGGFQIIANANDENAIAILRQRKKRSYKPFAVMVKNLEMAQKFVEMTSAEAAILESPAAPIVLLKDRALLATNINFNSPYLGLMVATTPLHYIIIDKMNVPIIATSGNLSEEPICISNDEAFDRLKGIVDLFLVHNRKIERAIDDSVVQVVNNQLMILRRARGYAPKQFTFKGNETILALGAHVKNTFSCSDKERVFLSQHLGDLGSEKTYHYAIKEQQAFQKFYQIMPSIVIHDLHPNYSSTIMAKELYKEIENVQIQHHEAHAWAGLFEFELQKSEIAIAIWDGSGFGHDAKIWGGEFYTYSSTSSLKRVAHLKSFRLIGAEKSFKEPWRVLLVCLFENFELEQVLLFAPLLKVPVSYFEIKILFHSWKNKINTMECSSMGRLFDAISALLGLASFNTFEGQAAMELQYAGERGFEKLIKESEFEKLRAQFPTTALIKWEPDLDQNQVDSFSWKPFLGFIIKKITARKAQREAFLDDDSFVDSLAFEFHYFLAMILIDFLKGKKLTKLLVGGGVFQNRLLLNLASLLCRENNIDFYFPKEIPTNDGGISFGQIIAWQHKINRTETT